MSSKQQTEADRLRTNLARNAERLAADPRMSPVAKQARVAREFLDTKTNVTALAQEHGANADGLQLRHDDVAGTNSADRAAASTNNRDAQDRAGKVHDPRSAAQMLARAEMTGDELLARAVAAHAAEQGWGEVLGSYTATRPAKAKPISELEEAQRGGSVADLFAFVVPKPSIISSINDSAIAQLAGRDDLQ